MRYVYPAVITKEDDGYTVRFPDIKNCFTDGATIPEALDMAADALNLMLMTMEDQGDPIPPASDIHSVACEGDAFVNLVCADTVEYRKLYGAHAVKKTLSIPAWLNTMAEQQGINFSSTLQKALKSELNLR